MHEQFLQEGFWPQLAHLNEECGEFVSAAGKTFRWGPDSVNPLLPVEQQETNVAWAYREAKDVVRAAHRLIATIETQYPRLISSD